MAPAGPAGPGIPFPLPAELAGREQVTDSSSQARTAQRFYRPELDAIRFLAFSLVFIHHLLGVETPLSKAVLETSALGMCLFFFLSSYLITELLQREKQSSGRVHLQAFYVRRALRIWRFILLSLRWASSSARFNLPWRFRTASS